MPARGWVPRSLRSLPHPCSASSPLVDGAGNPSLGVGECTVGPTAAAIGNAVKHALGVRIHDMPLTRERIMAALLKT